MLNKTLKYKYLLVSQFETRIRIVIDNIIIKLQPSIETVIELTTYQKRILDNLIPSTYMNKIQFIACPACETGIPSNEHFCIKCGNQRNEKSK